jgi:hypothetical protein
VTLRIEQNTTVCVAYSLVACQAFSELLAADWALHGIFGGSVFAVCVSLCFCRHSGGAKDSEGVLLGMQWWINVICIAFSLDSG